MNRRIERLIDRTRAEDWNAVGAATVPHDEPGLLEDPVEEIRAQLPDGLPSLRREFYVAYADDVPVARGSIEFPTLDNLTVAFLRIDVVPENRRRGHGRAVFDRLRKRASDEGRSTLIGEVPGPLVGESAGDAFASTLGAKEALRSVRRQLDLVDLDRTRIENLAAEARQAAGGYDLVEWIDRAPEDLVDDFASLFARMVTDAPIGELQIDKEVWDARRIREVEDVVVRRGRTCLSVGARTKPGGRLVGITEIGVSRHRPEIAYQWATIVAPEHRGHRLGQLLKAVNLLRLVDLVPGADRLMTWNADSNAFMIEVNERLGFRAVDRQSEWQMHI